MNELIAFIILLFKIIISNGNPLSISEITIIIIGKGDQYILNNKTLRMDNINYTFNDIPAQILINGTLQDYKGNMVYNLEKEESIITMRFNNLLTKCNLMFYNLDNIKSIDLSKFDSSEVTEMVGMFYGCTSLVSINLVNFKTSSVTNMGSMFYFCTKLTSLNLNSFDTSSVTNMAQLFTSCNSLTSLNLENFDTSSVEMMTVMFSNCTSLKILNLNNFNTSSVKSFHGIFKYCSSLLSVQIGSFDTSNANNLNHMFYGCSSLISLNLKHIDYSSVININKLVEDINRNIVFCVNETKSPKIIDQLIEIFNTSYKNNCSDICFTGSNVKLIPEKNKCVTNCFNDDDYILEYENICYRSCPNNTHISSDNHSCEADELVNIETVGRYSNIITDSELVNDNYMNTQSYIHPTEKGLIDIESSDTIYRETDKNLTNINTNDIRSYISNISSEIDGITNEEVPLISNWKDFFDGKIHINDSDPSSKDKIMKNIKENIQNGGINLTNLIEGDKKDLIKKETDTIYQITSTENQKENEYKDISTIQLGQCEAILKGIYGINPKLPLIIFKTDYFVPGIEIPIIGYEIFHPLNKSKLDLQYCKNSIINFDIPVSIDEDKLFKYDPESEYYTDECYSYTTDNGTDILLDDRHEEYNNDNLSLCENNCTFSEYDKETKKVKCDCQLKSKEFIISEVVNEENILSSYNFTNNSSSLNIFTMKCIYTLFSEEGLKNNIGNYVMIVNIFIFIILSILFYKVEFVFLLEKIQKISMGQNDQKTNNTKSKNKIKKKIKNKKLKGKNPTKKKSNRIITNSKKIKNNKKENIDSKKILISSNIKSSKIGLMPLKKEMVLISSSKNNIEIYKNKKRKNKILETYCDYELNTLSYEKALKKDKRSFFQYYKSLLKTKHPIIFSFFPINDYNPKLIKIALFLILFSNIYIINALFFNESTIHKIYKEGGIYNIINFATDIICSFFIAHFLYIFIKYISLSERNIVNFKNNTKNANYGKLRSFLSIKYVCFFILGFLFLLIFWYYLASFCAVFKNSQIYLIKNTIICLSISFIYPFVINILPCTFRMISLRSKDRKWVYTISKVLQFI